MWDAFITSLMLLSVPGALCGRQAQRPQRFRAARITFPKLSRSGLDSAMRSPALLHTARFAHVQASHADSVVVMPCFTGGGLGNWGVEIATAAIYAEVTGAQRLLLPQKLCGKLGDGIEPDEWTEAERHTQIAKAKAMHKEAEQRAEGRGALVSEHLEPFKKLFPRLPLTLQIQASSSGLDRGQRKAMSTAAGVTTTSANITNENCKCCMDFYSFQCGGHLTGDEIARATHQYLGPYLSCPPPASDIGKKTLVAHVRRQPVADTEESAKVRKDDIYYVSDQCYYPQPPCAYYEDIIEKGAWDNVVVIESPGVSDEKNNGCASHLVQKYEKVRLQKASLEEDVCAMHHAINMALSFSSFSTLFGLYLGLPEKRQVFFPFASGSLQLGSMGDADSLIRYNAEQLALHEPKAPLKQTLYAFPKFACTTDPEYEFNLVNATMQYPRNLLRLKSSGV